MRLYAIEQRVGDQVMINSVHTNQFAANCALDKIREEFANKIDSEGNYLDVERLPLGLVKIYRISDNTTCRFEIIELDAKRI